VLVADRFVLHLTLPDSIPQDTLAPSHGQAKPNFARAFEMAVP
jgi:hypothetical protein